MSHERVVRLEESDPLVGVTLRVEGREWTVTEHSRFEVDEGYWTHEWRCEGQGVTGYLLKEFDEQKQIRWFFTRDIAEDTVLLPDGETVEAWLGRTGGPQPPGALTHRGDSYRFAEATEGGLEGDSGEGIRKVVWEYWDERRRRNLAVERYPDGSFECFLGVYIDPRQVTLRPPAGAGGGGSGGAGVRARLAAHPFLAALISFPVFYLLAFLVGRPFDAAIAFAMVGACLLGWLLALGRAPAAGGMALVLGLIAIGIFLWFPPLTSGVGVLALFGTPAAVAWVGRLRGSADARPAVRYAAAFGVGAPLVVVGLYHYFSLAPGPHTPDQFLLALAPAVLGALAAWLLSGLVCRPSEKEAA